MNLHEYQSKRLFAEYGIPVPRGIPADSPNAAVKAAQELGGDLWVVKAQVHAGGRGKAGGVKLAQTPDEAYEKAAAILGIDRVLGTLARGKWASFACWNGDPFDMRSYPVAVYGEGELLFEE